MTRYITNGDEITDTQTGLIWQAKSLGPITWAEAMALEKGGWRLPTISELVTLIDYTTHNPASGFPEMESEWFWSSSPYANNYGYAWNVNFGYGYVDGNRKNGNGRVRLVRAGQCSAVDELSRLRAELEQAGIESVFRTSEIASLRDELTEGRRVIDALQRRVDAGVEEATRLAAMITGGGGMYLNAAPVPQPAAVYQCPRCATAMQVDETAKPAVPEPLAKE